MAFQFQCPQGHLLEAEEMERIMREAKSDAAQSGISCQYKI